MERVGDKAVYGQGGGADDAIALGSPRRGGRRGQQFGEQDWEFEFERLRREKWLWDSRPGPRPGSDECEGCLRGLLEERGFFPGRKFETAFIVGWGMATASVCIGWAGFPGTC